MTITAGDIIQDAAERANRLSPGETLSADDSNRWLRRLNIIVDELAAKNQFLYKSVLTSAAQTGHITLGAGSWAAISPGDAIVSATVTGYPMAPLTMAQYNALQVPTTTGSPIYYAPDGLSTVYVFPVATGQTIKLQTLTGVAAFADLTTAYTVPDGYRAALGARLAVRITPAGRITAQMLREETQAIGAVSNYKPAIVDVRSYARVTGRAHILMG
jgi:hypothetical protein